MEKKAIDTQAPRNREKERGANLDDFDNVIMMSRSVRRAAYFERIINFAVKKEARKEAAKILSKCDEEFVEMISHHYSKNRPYVINVILDLAKWRLNRVGKMACKDTDHFGMTMLDGVGRADEKKNKRNA